MNDNVEDCPVCLNTFDDTVKRPRTLPCGHTLCTQCIDELMDKGAVTCPTCRANHTVPEAGQFPISYITEGFIRRMRGVGLASLPTKPEDQTAPTPVTRPASNATSGLSRTAQSLLQERETKVLAAIQFCQEEQSQLADYLTTLGGWGGRQQRLEDELQTLVDQSKSVREVVRGEEIRVQSRQEQVQRRQQELQAVLQSLRTAAEQKDTYKLIENADHLVEKQDSHRTKEWLGVFPDVHVVTTVARVAEASCAALQGAANAAAAAAVNTAGTIAGGDCRLPTDSAALSSIADKVQALLAPPLTQAEELLPNFLLVEELLSLKQPARSLLQAGRVFAVQDVEGERRQARISLEDGRLHLYSLQAQNQDPTAVTLQMRELVPATPPCEVFLDLAWPGRAARRVVVSLPMDTPRGRQMVLLCSGQWGPCYAGTTMHGVECEGRPGEFLMGGDYQGGDGSGGASLVPHIGQHKDYCRSGKAGAVWGLSWADPSRGAQFGITTRDWPPGDRGWSCVFGIVVRGLQVVREAVRHHPITEVTVMQCGVMLLPQ